MALRWFLEAISTGMVKQPNRREGDNGLPMKLDKDMRMIGIGEVDGMKLNNYKEMYNLQATVSRSGGKECSGGFRMPLHYPRYKKEDYQRMEEWKMDMLLKEYGLACEGSLEEKRAYAVGAFLWPDQI